MSYNSYAADEAFIERTAERQMDRFDEKLLSGVYTQAEYDHQVALLDEWTQREYQAARRRADLLSYTVAG